MKKLLTLLGVTSLAAIPVNVVACTSEADFGYYVSNGISANLFSVESLQSYVNGAKFTWFPKQDNASSSKDGDTTFLSFEIMNSGINEAINAVVDGTETSEYTVTYTGISNDSKPQAMSTKETFDEQAKLNTIKELDIKISATDSSKNWTGSGEFSIPFNIDSNGGETA